jgi:hypothetical protein
MIRRTIAACLLSLALPSVVSATEPPGSQCRVFSSGFICSVVCMNFGAPGYEWSSKRVGIAGVVVTTCLTLPEIEDEDCEPLSQYTKCGVTYKYDELDCGGAPIEELWFYRSKCVLP